MRQIANPSAALSPKQFILAFGVVSMLADMVYEGARSVTGPFLATFGVSAAAVGLVTGIGEAAAMAGRLVTGPVSDRTQRHWALSIAGYAMTIVAVPLMAVTQAFWQVAGLIITERSDKAVRTPARDTMLAQASTDMGRGFAFALHEALDQSGAVAGPLIVAALTALVGYRAGFAVLAVPGALALLTLAWLRRAVPRPADYERHAASASAASLAGDGPLPGRFWLYLAFTGVSMAGFSTFAVLAYHAEVRHVVAAPVIPVTYALAMAAAALGALASGWLYDRLGLRCLMLALALSAAVPALAFSTRPLLIWVGAAVWGAATGMHESTLRAAVADLVPAARRGASYGIFGAVYGLAWLAGSTVIGALYGHAVAWVIWYGTATQAVAFVLLLPLLRASGRAPRTDGGSPSTR
jgi:MFS family permease